MTGAPRTISLARQASALKEAIQGLMDRTPVDASSMAGLQLHSLVGDLTRTISLSPAHADRVLLSAVQALKDLVTAYHEAGHVLAYHALTPRDRVRLDAVCFQASVDSGVEAGLTYTRTAAPWWPDPAQPGEVVRELACILAGRFAEPVLGGSVQLSGSDQDDRQEAARLLEWMTEGQQARAFRRAQELLENLDLHPLPHLAAHLYERWGRGETVIPFAELEPFLTTEAVIQ